MREALAREAFEEVGVRTNVNDLNPVLTMHRWCGDHERIDLFFVVEHWNGEIQNTEPNKCDDLSWFALRELPKNTIGYIRAAVECYLNNVRYCEFGWDR